MLWYFKFLARRPFLLLLFVGVIAISCIIVSLTVKKLPDFSDPTLGFEARGTSIGLRLTAWKNLNEASSPSGSLIVNPAELWQARRPTMRPHPRQKKHKNKKNKHKNNKLKQMPAKPTDVVDDYVSGSSEESVVSTSPTNGSTWKNAPDAVSHWNRSTTWDYGHNVMSTDEQDYELKLNHSLDTWKQLREWDRPSGKIVDTGSRNFFCENPNPEYAHFVVERVQHNLTVSLFEINGLLAMCDLEFQITQTTGYQELCENYVDYNHCCRPWSLPNYVALLANRSSCFDLEPQDVVHARNLLHSCVNFYQTRELTDQCATQGCKVPHECAQHNAVFNMLFYLSDVHTLSGNVSSVNVKSAMIFIPIGKSTKALPFYHELERKPLANQLVAVVAMDLGVKSALFDECLLHDSWLLAIGGVFIMVCMCLYTRSLVLTLMTSVAIGFSLGIAYFVYAIVFTHPFFPFMNLLAVIVIVGIGADDAFIYVKVWNCAIEERELAKTAGTAAAANSARDSLAELVATTMKHAAISMGVTSLTTAVAFYSSLLNSITAVRCFGLFAGTAVLCNYLLMITWLPASVSLIERVTCMSPACCTARPLQWLYSVLNAMGRTIEKVVVHAVVEWPIVWLVLFSAMGLLSIGIVFYWPRLQLPNALDFGLFDAKHPFEVYDSHYKNLFAFETAFRDSATLPIRFVWGIDPVDSGNYMDPMDRGKLKLDASFNVSSRPAQEFLLNFCLEFKRQPFYRMPSSPSTMHNCFIESFVTTMDRRCIDPMSSEDRTPCCQNVRFPYEPHIFERCVPEIIAILHESPRFIYLPGVAGLRFARKTVGNGTINERPPLMQALVVEFESNQPYTMSYTTIGAFEADVQRWFDAAMVSAPPGMRGAWFISDLEFYDLQDTLSRDTMSAIVVAMSVAWIVLFLVTLNMLISLLAILTVTFTIFTTIAAIVLMGWKLNVLESIAISTAIGLTIDFSLHYGNNYRYCPEKTRVAATKYSLVRMIGPTAMAALTTGAAGAVMLPSRVLAYIQIGKFLVIVMAVSWAYATLYLMSALRLFGPQNGFGQLEWPKCKKTTDTDANEGIVEAEPRSSCTATDQLLSPSNSNTGDLAAVLEAHEMQTLIGSGIIKPITELEARPLNFDRAFHRNDTTRYSEDGLDHDSSPSSTNGIPDIMYDQVTVAAEMHEMHPLEESYIDEPLTQLEGRPLSFERALHRTEENRLSAGLPVAVEEASSTPISAIANIVLPTDKDFVQVPLH